MPDYRKMYTDLFNAVTHVVLQLQDAQRESEETYIESKDTCILRLPSGGDKNADES